MDATDETIEPVPPPTSRGPSPVWRGVGVAFDVLLMAGVLLAGWWAWDGAGAARADRPAWMVGDVAAGGDGLAVQMAGRSPWKLGERELAHDGELATAAHGAKSTVRINAHNQVLFAQVARALELLSREGVRQATINVVD